MASHSSTVDSTGGANLYKLHEERPVRDFDQRNKFTKINRITASRKKQLDVIEKWIEKTSKSHELFEFVTEYKGLFAFPSGLISSYQWSKYF